MVRSILVDAGVHMLDGDAVELHGVGFAGVKGFAGGFGRGALGPWGEPSIKQFVQEALNEALKLESALARLKTKHRIAVLHYAPIRDTVEGEPVEILPWLGSSRLEEPLTRFEVSAVVHGHAHKGSPEGRTSDGHSGLQRRSAGAACGVSGPAALPDHRGSARVRVTRSTSSRMVGAPRTASRYASRVPNAARDRRGPLIR